MSFDIPSSLTKIGNKAFNLCSSLTQISIPQSVTTIGYCVIIIGDDVLQQIEGDVEEMRQFLEIFKSIGEHHHRDQHFNEGMNQLLLQHKDQIKQTLSNSEIFHIFENNKKIVLFLIKKDIITISEEIYEVIDHIIYNLESE